MATVKGYSVSDTGESGSQSTVYSLSPGTPGADRTGRAGAYDYPTEQGLVEARTPTLLGTATANTTVASLGNATNAGTNIAALANTSVVATTTTITGEGAGLIVGFDTTSTGGLPAFGSGTASNGPSGNVPSGNNYKLLCKGEGYAASDTVQIDGWVDSVVPIGTIGAPVDGA